MMKETKYTDHSDDSLARRWFSDDYFDLILWEDGNGNVVRFELCYGKFKDEHVLIWNQDSGCSHRKVDDGEQVLGRFKMSPVYIADGQCDSESLADKFRHAGRDIDQTVSDFVFKRIKEYYAQEKT